MVGGKVDHDLIEDRHGIAPDRPIVRSKNDPLGRRLNRRSTCKESIRVVAKKGHVGHLTACRQMRGHVVGLTDEPRTGNRIHVRGISRLQRSFPA